MDEDGTEESTGSLNGTPTGFAYGLTEEDLKDGKVFFSMSEPFTVSRHWRGFHSDDVPLGDVDDRLEAIVDDIVEWEKSPTNHSVRLPQVVSDELGSVKRRYNIRGVTNVLTAMIVHGHNFLQERYSEELSILERHVDHQEKGYWEAYEDGGSDLPYQKPLSGSPRRYYTNMVLDDEIDDASDFLGIHSSAYVRQCVAMSCIDLPFGRHLDEWLGDWCDRFDEYVDRRVDATIERI